MTDLVEYVAVSAVWPVVAGLPCMASAVLCALGPRDELGVMLPCEPDCLATKRNVPHACMTSIKDTRSQLSCVNQATLKQTCNYMQLYNLKIRNRSDEGPPKSKKQLLRSGQGLAHLLHAAIHADLILLGVC